MRVLFGITLVLILALLAASPPMLLASAVTANDQDAATAYVAIMNGAAALSQNADMMTQASPAYAENTIPANMAITMKEEALIAPELVSGMEYRSLIVNSYAIATTSTSTGGKEVGAQCACYRSRALPCSPI